MKIRAAIGLCVIALLVVWHPLRCSSEPDPPECSGLAIRSSEVSAGDIVLFRTTTWRGRIVRALQIGDDDFAHVGIVVGNIGGVWVAHASPAATSVVRIDRLETIVTEGGVTSVALYRPKVPRPVAARAAAIATDYAERRTPFDFDFALSDDSEVYCTELIWLCYRLAGLVSPDASGILFPGDLVRSGLFEATACGGAPFR